jgi:hypothetical protein
MNTKQCVQNSEFIKRGKWSYPSEDRRIPCKTVFNALAAVAPMHMMNPNR